MNETQTFIARIRKLVGAGDLTEAVRQLQVLLEGSPALDDALLQSAQLQAIREQIRRGVVSEEHASLTHNRIGEGILDLLRELESPTEIPPAALREIERISAITNSENVISNASLKADENLIVGNKNRIQQTFITYNGHQEIPRALTLNPFNPEVFLGREADLQAIHDQLFSGDNLLLLVNGTGGIGKTSIASKYYHRYQHRYAHTAWVLSEKSIADALLLLAIPLGLQFPEQMRREERLDTLLQALANLKKPCLLVIDNANEPDDLHANYQRLRRCGNFHLLLTTRITNFAQAKTWPISGLPEEEALQLFQRHYSRFHPQTETTLFQEIYAAVNGNTLVLELLAKNLALFNRLRTNYALEDLLADLRQKGLFGLSRSQAVATDYQSRGGMMRIERPEDIIAAMYNLGELPEAEQRLLSILAVLPAESVPFEMLEKMLPEVETLEEGLLALAQKGWIEYNEVSQAFKCSPVIQEVIRNKNNYLEEEYQPLIESLNKELSKDLLHINNYNSSTLFVRYAEAILLFFKKHQKELGILSRNIGNFYMGTGDLNKALKAYSHLKDIQERLFSDNPDNSYFINSLALCYEKLGTLHQIFGDIEQALIFFKNCNFLQKELSKEYPENIEFKRNLAISYSKIGNIQQIIGSIENALTFYEYEVDLFEQIHEAHPENIEMKNGLAVAFEKLGNIEKIIGNPEWALIRFMQYNRIEKELYEKYPQNLVFKENLAISYGKIGSVYRTNGNLTEALVFFEKYKILAKELYEAYPQNVDFKNGLAISYAELGDVQSILGKAQL